MIFIDLEHKKPTDLGLAGWHPWTSTQWQAWQAKSNQLNIELEKLEKAGKRLERNELIDANSQHWGALKDWLLALSGGKCWFSEARDVFSHYDVEHFRPKKQAKALDGLERDGYWWLAFDYMNFRACGNVGNRKKGGWFPLKAGSICSSFDSRCEESEATYLLDPIVDHDVSLLTFNEEGRAVPVLGVSEWQKQRVLETVKRLKLNEHVALAEERRKVWQKADMLIQDFLTASAGCAHGTNPAAQGKLAAVCSQIRAMTEASAELSSVARCCLLLRNKPQLSRLIS